MGKEINSLESNFREPGMFALKTIDIDTQAEIEFNREKSNRLLKQVFGILADGAIKFSWQDAEEKKNSGGTPISIGNRTS
jgi:hypothetical protein